MKDKEPLPRAMPIDKWAASARASKNQRDDKAKRRWREEKKSHEKTLQRWGAKQPYARTVYIINER